MVKERNGMRMAKGDDNKTRSKRERKRVDNDRKEIEETRGRKSRR
jgi:hypothetical protein